MMQDTSAVFYTDSGGVCLIARVEEIWWFGIYMKRNFTKHFLRHLLETLCFVTFCKIMQMLIHSTIHVITPSLVKMERKK